VKSKYEALRQRYIELKEPASGADAAPTPLPASAVAPAKPNGR
jgi:hypothetical protein